MDAAGFESATISAIFDACLAVLVFAAQHPERVDGLVLWNPFAQGWRSAPFEQLVGWEDGEQVEAYDRAWRDVHAHWGRGDSLRMQMPARYQELPETDSMAEFSGGYQRQVEQFMFGAARDVNSDRALMTVLFTDIVGSTEHAALLGDARWREVLVAHERMLRREVEAVGGRVVQLIGDGSLSAFDGPARAIRCAERICAAAAELDVEIRAGLHTGECEVIDDGMAVHIAARVSARAGGGEVLVSRTVRDLVTGSGIGLQSRGEHEPKGVPGSWELFAVGPETAPLPAPLARHTHPTSSVANPVR
jgi:class 3 adenylate cyclase